MKFASTIRNTYTKAKVRELRQNHKLIKPKKEGVPTEKLESILGDLQAAGHLMINGFTSFGVENEKYPTDTSSNPLLNKSPEYNKASYTLKFNCYSESDMGERPHVTGYLESASSADKKPYRIKGWFNEDGSIRIELVK